MAREIIWNGFRNAPWRRLALVDLPVFRSVLGGYALARAVFVQSFSLSARMTWWLDQVGVLDFGRRPLETLIRLALPTYGTRYSTATLAVAGTLLLVMSLWSVARLRRSGIAPRLWLFGLVWVIVSLAPVGFNPVAPAAGRYLYLTSIGLGMMAGALVLMSIAALLPLLRRPRLGTVWRWSGETEKLTKVDAGGSAAPGKIRSRIFSSPGEPSITRYRAVSGARHRLVLVTRMKSRAYPLAASSETRGWSEARPPRQILQSTNHLYGGPAFCWIEARTRDGQLHSVSRLHEIRSGLESGLGQKDGEGV